MSEALDLYLREMKITKLFGKLFGYDVFTDNFKFNFMTFWLPFDLFVYNFGQIYSAYYYRENFVDIIFSLVTWAYGFQGIIVCYTMYFNRHIYWKLHLDFIAFHKKYADNNILLDYNKKTRRLNNVLCACIFLFSICSILYPLIDALFLQKKKVLGFGFLIPFTDPATDFGFYINFAFQCSNIVCAGIGYIAIFRLYWLLFGHLCTKLEVLTTMVEDIKEITENNVSGKHDATISNKLNDIVDFHIDYLDFFETLEGIGSKMLLVQAMSTAFQVSINLLVLSVRVWYPGYFIILLATVVLMTICAVGTIVEIKNDILCDAVYENSWYLLSIKNRKKLLVILIASQRMKSLSFCDIAPVNVSSFLEIYKKIYTGFMILHNTNEK